MIVGRRIPRVMYGLQRSGLKIRDTRQRKGLTQREVADDLSVRQSTVCRWEQGTANPTDAHKAAIAKIFGVQVTDLFPR